MSYIALLRRNPQFARLWAAMLISFIGDWFNTIALAAIVSRFTEGSGLAISLFLLARFLPPLLVTPLAGALADRFDRKRLLFISDLLRVAVVLALLLVQSADQLWLLYVLTMLQFALGAFFDPARSALTPATVAKDDLIRANVLGSATWSAALWLGALTGGLVAGMFGTATALVIDASSFLVSALLIISIRPDHEPVRASHTDGFHLRDIADGIRYARQHPDIAATLFVKFGGNIGNADSLLIMYATVLFPLFITGVTQNNEQAGALSLGILYTGFGIGAVAGLLLMNRFNDGTVRRMRRLIVVGFALITVGWCLFGVAGSVWFAAFALFIKAIGSNTYWTYSSVILQKTVDDNYLGRMFSLDFAGFQLATVISVLITGLAMETLGNSKASLVVLGTAAASLVPLAFWASVTRWLERTNVEHPASQPAHATGD